MSIVKNNIVASILLSYLFSNLGSNFNIDSGVIYVILVNIFIICPFAFYLIQHGITVQDILGLVIVKEVCPGLPVCADI